jgi:hypothetical protein
MSPTRRPWRRRESDPLADRVIESVEGELRRRPSLRTGILQELASAIDPNVRDMDPRRFHTEYVVPAQLRLAKPRRKRKKRRPSGSPVTGTHTGGAGAGVTPRADLPPVQPEIAPAATASASAPAETVAGTAEPSSDAGDIHPPPTSGPYRSEPARPRSQPPPGSMRPPVDHRLIRSAFLEWARSLARAETETEWVHAVTDVDRYVERVLKLTRST